MTEKLCTELILIYLFLDFPKVYTQSLLWGTSLFTDIPRYTELCMNYIGK